MEGVCESTLQVVCSYSDKGLIVINVPEGPWKCCGSGDSNSSLGSLIVLGVRGGLGGENWGAHQFNLRAPVASMVYSKESVAPREIENL